MLIVNKFNAAITLWNMISNKMMYYLYVFGSRMHAKIFS